MSARPTRRLPPAGGFSGIQRIELQEFGRRVATLRADQGMSQSDLARAVWGETTDARGYVVAKGRDRISQYEKGRSVPEPHNLKALADALGTTPEALAPDVTAATVDREEPAVQFTVVRGHPDKVHLTINTLVSYAVAIQVVQLLDKAIGGVPQ